MSGWLRTIADSIAKRFSLKQPPEWFIDYFGGGASASGIKVGHQAALQFTPFWAAVRIISGTIAALPFKVYHNLEGGGKEAVPKHPVYQLLHTRPNDYVDAVTFLETRMAHVLCYGNGYAEIQRDGAGRPVALWPLLPDKTKRKITEDGKFVYEVTLPAGDKVPLPDANVLHIKGLGFDGYTGYDVVSYHKEALGLGIGVKEYGARFFANNAAPGGVLEHPGPAPLGDKAFKHLKESWAELHQGLENAHRVAILEEGTKWHEFGIDPQRAQALEVQKWTVDDCSRIFQIPPHMLGSMEFSKYNNVEELRLDFLTMTMLYWFRKWEQECSYKLLMPREQGKLFCEFVADGLLRGNVAARTKYYQAGRQWGFLSINDIRAKENMNPIGPAGDVYLDPLNMVPAGSLKADSDNKGPWNDSVGDNDGGGQNSIRAAHRALLASQWRRIITKQNNANGQKENPAWWEKQREFAHNVLDDATRAYASVRGIGAVPAIVTLDGLIKEIVSRNVILQPDDAERLADRIMQEIGGDYAAAETQTE